MNIKDAARGTSVEYDIKCVSRIKDERGYFHALIDNHARKVKYRYI